MRETSFLTTKFCFSDTAACTHCRICSRTSLAEYTTAIILRFPAMWYRGHHKKSKCHGIFDLPTDIWCRIANLLTLKDWSRTAATCTIFWQLPIGVSHFSTGRITAQEGKHMLSLDKVNIFIFFKSATSICRTVLQRDDLCNACHIDFKRATSVFL